jgi:hypothetical protein
MIIVILVVIKKGGEIFYPKMDNVDKEEQC